MVNPKRNPKKDWTNLDEICLSFSLTLVEYLLPRLALVVSKTGANRQRDDYPTCLQGSGMGGDGSSDDAEESASFQVVPLVLLAVRCRTTSSWTGSQSHHHCWLVQHLRFSRSQWGLWGIKELGFLFDGNIKRFHCLPRGICPDYKSKA